MLKKFLTVMAFILFVFCFYSLYAFKSPELGAYADEFEIYTSYGSFGCNVLSADKKTYPFIPCVKGESCLVNVSYERVLSDFSAKKVFSETTDYGESFYAYSPKLRYKIYLNGKAVNIHYFVGKTGCKLGTPLIYGGY